MRKILEGIRVIDLTTAYSGPFGTMQLADFGAEVIKVEHYKNGDPSRGWTPFYKENSVSYPAFNRNKKSLTLNLKEKEGKRILLQLVRTADVVVENFRPGTMEKLGLNYERLQDIKPDLIMASLSGYGQTGPMAKMSAYSNLAEAMSGVMYLTGFPDGLPTGSGVAFGDSIAGLYMALAIMMALYYKKETGEGQYIDIAMTDCLVAMLEHNLVYSSLTGKDAGRMGNRDQACYPYDLFETKDGYCFLSVSTVSDWSPFAHGMGLDELLTDPRFLTNELRVKNADELAPYINAWTRRHTRAEIEKIFREAGQGYSPLLCPSEVLQNEQILARGMICETESVGLGRYKIANTPMKMSLTPGGIRSAAPQLGADTEFLLKELGYEKEKIQELRKAEII